MTAHGATQAEVTPARCEAARALAAQVLTSGENGVELPTAGDATTAVDRLNSYGEQLRHAVLATVPSDDSVPYLLGEADNRLGLSLEPALPSLPLTPAVIVHRAQNLARLVQGLLTAQDASSPPAGGGHTTEGNADA